MSKCLVTKYNGVVNDPTIKKINALRINIEDGEPTGNLKFVALGNPIYEISSGDVLWSDNTNTPKKTFGYPDQENTLSYGFMTGSGTLDIHDKYNLISLPSHNRLYIDLDDFRKCSRLTTIDFANEKNTGKLESVSDLTTLSTLSVSLGKVTGDISVLAKLTSLNVLNVAFSKMITGDISTLANFPNLEVFFSAGSNVTGSIEDLVKAYIAKGVTSGSITCNFPNTVTLNGNMIADANNTTLSWTPSSFTVYNNEYTLEL